jgi:hypothetical protein
VMGQRGWSSVDGCRDARAARTCARPVGRVKRQQPPQQRARADVDLVEQLVKGAGLLAHVGEEAARLLVADLGAVGWGGWWVGGCFQCQFSGCVCGWIRVPRLMSATGGLPGPPALPVRPGRPPPPTLATTSGVGVPRQSVISSSWWTTLRPGNSGLLRRTWGGGMIGSAVDKTGVSPQGRGAASLSAALLLPLSTAAAAAAAARRLSPLRICSRPTRCRSTASTWQKRSRKARGPWGGWMRDVG